MTDTDLRSFLEEKYRKYNCIDFIERDPISIPHKFSRKEDIEIAGFFSSAISWGQRPVIIKNANELMRRMDFSPHDFILNHTKKDLHQFKGFKHRTFKGTDCVFFMKSLQNIYKKHKSLESAFKGSNVKDAITNFRKLFFSVPHPERTKKHISNPEANSACKRLNMFLRWMVRKDSHGVDFGIWSRSRPHHEGEIMTISSAHLMCPIDVHSGNVARKLGLLTRKQNDWQSVKELTGRLSEFDSNDPVKYDFALFGLGVFEKF